MKIHWVKNEVCFHNWRTLRLFHFSEEFYLFNLSLELVSLAALHTPGGAGLLPPNFL